MGVDTQEQNGGKEQSILIDAWPRPGEGKYI